MRRENMGLKNNRVYINFCGNFAIFFNACNGFKTQKQPKKIEDKHHYKNIIIKVISHAFL